MMADPTGVESFFTQKSHEGQLRRSGIRCEPYGILTVPGYLGVPVPVPYLDDQIQHGI